MTNYLSKKKESITDWSYQSPAISLQPVLIFVHILKEILKTGETYNGKKKKSFLNLIAYLFILLTQFQSASAISIPIKIS